MNRILPFSCRLAILALAIGCGEESGPSGPGTGDLTVHVTTSGGGLDSSYALLIDGDTVGEFGANDTRIINDLQAGDHVVRLAGIADNCESNYADLVRVYVRRDEPNSLSFDLSCVAAGPVLLIISSQGPFQDPDGYRYGLDEAPSNQVAINDTILLPLVEPGDHQFRIDNIESDCYVTPDDAIDFTVVGDSMLTVHFYVVCLSVLRNRIVFASTRGGGSSEDDLEIWSVKTDGSDPVRLTNNSVTDDEPSVSDGGYSILFTRKAAGAPSRLWLMDSDGSNPFQWMTDGSVASPAWAPGGQVAWSERLGSTNVYDLKYFDWTSPDNSTAGSVDPGRTTRRFSPVWSADILRLIFATDSSINSILLNGTNELVLRHVSGVTHLDRARQSDRIVFNAPAVADPTQPGLYGTGAWIMNQDGSGLVQVMTSTANSSWNSPRWDPTGTRLVFSRVVSGSADSKIWIADADGSNAVEVAGMGNMNLHPSWP